MADKQHWLDRWRDNRIGFHEATVNRFLETYLPGFGLPPGAVVFVPLCGKAHDLRFIARQGFEVIGIEISRIAIEAFFAENEIGYERIDSDRFAIYRAPGMTLLEGDFFDLRNDDLGACALIYDRAALIALTAEQRPAYYDHMLSIIPAVSNMLLITLEYDTAEMQGPPYSVHEDELRRHYGEAFAIKLLERNDILDERPRWREVGLSALDEAVFRLDRRGA